MGQSYDEWIAKQDQALVAKTRAGDEGNKVLLNQINWIWVHNLMNKKPELNPSSVETDWVGTYAKVLMPGANYYLFFSEEWEMGLVFHVMIPPDDWILIYLRHRFTEISPFYAFTISSEAAQGEPYSIDLEAAQSYLFQDLSHVWR